MRNDRRSSSDSFNHINSYRDMGCDLIVFLKK
jgi:hypothetical protein